MTTPAAVTVKNTSPHAVRIDDAGHRVEPGGFASADPAVVVAAVDAGRLVEVTDPRDADPDADLDPGARAALDATAKANKTTTAKAKTTTAKAAPAAPTATTEPQE